MKRKNFIRRSVLLLVSCWMPAAFLACSRLIYDDGSCDDGEVPSVQLSLSVGDSFAPPTKMSDPVTQVIDAGTGTSVFRGIRRLLLFPFTRTGTGSRAESPVLGTDQVLHGDALTLRYGYIANGNSSYSSWNAAQPNHALVANNNGHILDGVSVPMGTASVLVYGEAGNSGEGNDPRLYGALQLSGIPSGGSAGDMTFTPVPIAEAPDQAKAQNLANYLTAIAGASYNTNIWYRYTGNTSLSSYFAQFTNGGAVNQTTSGEVIAGSSEAVRNLVTNLYTALEGLSISNTTQRYVRSAILNAILSGGVTRSGTTITFPESLSGYPGEGLPEGSVGFRWNGSTKQFEVSEEGNGIRLVPPTDYCYPPSLWYFTNSTLSVSTDEGDMSGYYVNTNSWNAILDHYDDNKTVVHDASAAAIDRPLQYGVGLFSFTFKNAATSSLTDKAGKSIAVNLGRMPVTGIIIGEQWQQSYQFHPLHGHMYYIWDTYTRENGDSGSYKAYVRSSSQKAINILVLETEQTEDPSDSKSNEAVSVHFAVELLNDTGTEFTGATGIVQKDAKFYLPGILSLNDTTIPEGVYSVFMQDCQTKATIQVNSLAGAYNTIPNLQDPQLEIGVQVHMDWTLVTPSEHPLY